MGELGALFNPGMRHEIEERQSKANRREEEGNARDGDLRIDLASGVAVINAHGKAGAASQADSEAESTPRPTARPTSRPAPQKSRQPKSGHEKPTPVVKDGEAEKRRTGPVPTSKASRAAR